MQKRGLGRGLESLIPGIGQRTDVPLIVQDDSTNSADSADSATDNRESAGEGGALLRNLPLSKIVPNPNQPRKYFDEESFSELVSSVKEYGLVQPVVVRASGSLFELVVGERRWRAAKEAGLKTIPAIVRNTSDVEALEIAIIENVQRQDLNPLEEAAAYYHLIEDFGFTQNQLAERVGKQRSTIANTIRLLKLPESVKTLVIEGKISVGHAKVLLSLLNPKAQIRLAERIIREGMTVRQAEDQVWLSQNPPKRTPSQSMPLYFRQMARDLGKQLSTKVLVKIQGEKGRVEIHFSDEAELERILNTLAGEKKPHNA
ncbi:ParB/RepB/Spo0J family partition protein [Candidatus Aquicultor secundus]|uniref:ParB/RepB/Spo0J family partition protein n=1 Tax=Candidatus Aquicultor secundus TaxID=1973895 RepID=UPI00257A30B1|nr:ParB/RepB/Spo0J family partition protein [Candidatus Aquicultor secundus]